MFLQGKKILFFSARAFDIPDNIKLVLEKEGARVDFYDERPGNTFFVKALIRIDRNLLARYIDRYHQRIVEQTAGNDYDYIFFIKGESVSQKTLNHLRRLHRHAKFIIYHWDSIANNRNALRLLPYFDQVFSFDRSDCEKIGMNFLPLFYMTEYAAVSEIHPVNYKYDLMFVGTVHSDRYRILEDVRKQILGKGGRCFLYYFFQSKVLFYKMKMQQKSMRSLTRDQVHFKSLTKDQLLELYAESRIVIDIQHPKQTGLTMRCMETLGAKRKLITTNSQIKDYDFYDPNNILVIDRNQPVIPLTFIQSAYRDVPEQIYRKYSLENWIKTIFQ